MRKALAAVAVVVLGALASVTTAQAGNATITNTRTQITGEPIFVPCANGGLGENVDFTGVVHNVSRVTVNGNRFSMTFEGNDQSFNGVGEITGDTYVGNGTIHEATNGSFTNGQFVDTFGFHFNANGQGSAPSWHLNGVAHVTLNANGDVTVAFDNLSSDCL